MNTDKRARQKSLMHKFLASIDGMSNEEADAATGISYESIRKYRDGDWVRLNSLTERKMSAWVDATPPLDRDGYRAGLLRAAEEAEALAARLRALGSSASPEYDALDAESARRVREAEQREQERSRREGT